MFLSNGCKKKTETPEDPCANTVCLNGGTCVDGSCSCPTGYSGADCGTERTPTKIAITGIKVTNFPGLDGTSTWDPITNTNPDLLVVVRQGLNTLITTGSVNNISAGSVTIMPGVSPTDITDIVTQLNIELWDQDTPPVDGNDTMGNIDFSIYTNGQHFPTTLTVTGGSLTFELTLSYTY